MKITKLRTRKSEEQNNGWTETLEEKGLEISSVARALLPGIQPMHEFDFKKICLVRITSNDRVKFSTFDELVFHIESKGFRRSTPEESCHIAANISIEQYEKPNFDCIIFMHNPLVCVHKNNHQLRLTTIRGRLWLRTIVSSTLSSMQALFSKNYGLVFAQD